MENKYVLQPSINLYIIEFIKCIGQNAVQILFFISESMLSNSMVNK